MQETLPFQTFGQVLAFVIHGNPARFIRRDISEIQRKSEPHPLRDWNIIATKFHKELKTYKSFTIRCQRSGEMFERFYLKDPPEDLDDIAHYFGVSSRTVRRQMREAWDYLDSRFKAMEVLPNDA